VNNNKFYADGRETSPGPTETVNMPLRELAGRLKKLSYRDMQRVAEALFDAGAPFQTPVTKNYLVEAILGAADKLEKA
jgi:hypothetical protein